MTRKLNVTKKVIKNLLAACAVFVAAAVITQTAAAGLLPALSGIELTPDAPTAADFIVISVDGEVPTDGYTFPDLATVSVAGQDIFIDVFAQSPGGIVLPIVLPLRVPAEVGFLAAGDYQVFADLFVDGVLADTFNTSFVVAVPLPAAFWLFASSLILLLRTSVATRRRLRTWLRTASAT